MIVMARSQDPCWDDKTLEDLFRFRYRVFHESLGWEVETREGMERDGYDDLELVYMVAKSETGDIDGCWRLLPTTGAYMLKDTFPQLLQGTPAPQSEEVWELSRFAVTSTGRGDLAQAALNKVTFDMLRSAVEFALEHGVRRYVTVTSVAIERLFRSAGIRLKRFGNGRAERIGKVLTVACSVEIDDALCRLVGCQAPNDKENWKAA